MTIASPPQSYTPEELERLNDGPRFELVDGQLVVKGPMAKLSTRIANRITSKIEIYLEPHPIAASYSSEQGYQCFGSIGDPGRVRKPDVSVVLDERVAADAAHEGWFHIRPDIVIEIVSLNDLANDLMDRVEDYAAVGVPLIVVVYPEHRRIEIHRAGRGVEVFRDDGVIKGEPVLPGLSIRVADVLPPR